MTLRVQPHWTVFWAFCELHLSSSLRGWWMEWPQKRNFCFCVLLDIKTVSHCLFPHDFELSLHSQQRQLQFSLLWFFGGNCNNVCWKRCMLMYDRLFFLTLCVFLYLSLLQWPLCWKMITLFEEQGYQGALRQKKWSFIGVQAMDLKVLSTASMAGATLWR